MKTYVLDLRARVVLFLTLTTLCVAAGHASQIAYTLSPNRLPYAMDGNTTHFPYAASHDINTPNSRINRVVIAIHGIDPISDRYVEHAQRAASPIPGQSDTTLSIAPQFLQEKQTDGLAVEDAMLYWKVSPFWGSHRAYCKQHGDMPISSFAILDSFVQTVCNKTTFPQLKSIVIFGHSAGGQMVNRYAAISAAEEEYARPLDIAVRYVVSSPSSYLYFNDKRWVPGTTHEFAVPEDPCRNYNDYGHGLRRLYHYHLDRGGAETMIARYPTRHVVYLVGARDNKTDAPSLSITCASMLQGVHRLERGQIYYEYLKEFFGSDIIQRHIFEIVPNSGHSSATIMDSEPGRKYLFDYAATQ